MKRNPTLYVLRIFLSSCDHLTIEKQDDERPLIFERANEPNRMIDLESGTFAASVFSRQNLLLALRSLVPEGQLSSVCAKNSSIVDRVG